MIALSESVVAGLRCRLGIGQERDAVLAVDDLVVALGDRVPLATLWTLMSDGRDTAVLCADGVLRLDEGEAAGRLAA